MTTPYTIKKLTDVEDSAVKFGLAEMGEARFAKDDLDAEDTGVSLHRIRAGQRQPFAHKHDAAEEIYVVLAGSGRAKFDDAIVDIAQCAQDQHRQLAAGGPQRLHQRESVELRQHSVDDRQIHRDRGGQVQTRDAVCRGVHRVTRLAQRLRQVVARNIVIFDNQNVHGLISYRR